MEQICDFSVDSGDQQRLNQNISLPPNALQWLSVIDIISQQLQSPELEIVCICVTNLAC